MRDSDCVTFLQWALPRLHYRWPGFRKVRRQVCKRLARRLVELGLEDPDAYRRYLARHEAEWPHLDDLCRITISRFGRDRQVFQTLAHDLLPLLARRALETGRTVVDVWSAGCGAGEEPFSLAMLAAHSSDPDLMRVSLRIVATDADRHQLERARIGVYPASSLREIPAGLRHQAFDRLETGLYSLRRPLRLGVELCWQDLRRELPTGPFSLILCRNLAFTYFDIGMQRVLVDRLADRLIADGYLVIGSHERLPMPSHRFEARQGCPGVYRATG